MEFPTSIIWMSPFPILGFIFIQILIAFCKQTMETLIGPALIAYVPQKGC